MADITEFSRLIVKRSSITGQTPTITTASTINEMQFETDIFVGELYSNVEDDRVFIRTNNGILEFNVVPSGITTDTFTTGATVVGDVAYFDTTAQLSAYTLNIAEGTLWSAGTGTDSIVAKNSNSTNGGNNSSILAGVNHSIVTGVTNSVILGGSGLTATESNCVYAPSIELTTGNIDKAGFHLGETEDTGVWLLSISPTQGSFMVGADYDSGFIARGTTSAILNVSSGRIQFDTDSGLVDGNSFSPTTRMNLNTVGNLAIGKGVTSADVNTRVHIQSLNTTSGSTGIKVDNGTDDLFSVRGDGLVSVNGATQIIDEVLGVTGNLYITGKEYITRNVNNFLYEQEIQNTNIGIASATATIWKNGQDKGLEVGIKGDATTSFSGYGNQGDAFIRLSTGSNDLNIITSAGATQLWANSAVGVDEPNMSVFGGRVGINQFAPTSTNTLEIYDRGTQSVRLLELTDVGALGINVIPTAKLHIKGVGTTSATTGLDIINSGNTSALKVLDDGVVQLGNLPTAPTVGATLEATDTNGSLDWVTGSTQVFQTKVSLSSVQILALNTTPVELIPAQGAGTIINPIAITTRMNFGTAAYTTNINTITRNVGSSNSITTVAIVDATSDVILRSDLQSFGSLNTTYIENTGLEVSQATGDPLVGDGTMDIYINYEVITL